MNTGLIWEIQYRTGSFPESEDANTTFNFNTNNGVYLIN